MISLSGWVATVPRSASTLHDRGETRVQTTEVGTFGSTVGREQLQRICEHIGLANRKYGWTRLGFVFENVHF
jgi:hypothetical protein